MMSLLVCESLKVFKISQCFGPQLEELSDGFDVANLPYNSKS